jgi:hypothetical protein
MANWQYDKRNEAAPAIPTGQLPISYQNPVNKAVANSTRYTGWLECPALNPTHFFFWVHDITAAFNINGSFAQSPRFRRFYPRNFSAPVFTINGQCPDQKNYGDLVEWVRQAQKNTIVVGDGNVTKLVIPPGRFNLPAHKEREQLEMTGHINAIERSHERWVNSPEFTFNFTVVSSDSGLFKTGRDEMISAMKTADRSIAEALINEANKERVFTTDPDGSVGRKTVYVNPGTGQLTDSTDPNGIKINIDNPNKI